MIKAEQNVVEVSLSFPSHSRRAQYLCPSDSRVIVALGDMYEQQGNIESAKMCFWRAYCVGDVEGTALFSLARCYEKSGNDCEAAAAYTQFIRQCESRGVSCRSSLSPTLILTQCR